MNIADFKVDKGKCIGCSQCVKVCPGGILYLDKDKKSNMKDIDCFGWSGCWKCGHCLSVCPTGAISIFGHSAEDCIPPVDTETAAPVLDALISNRHSCRRYLDKNVDREIIDDMLSRLGNAPNGGNKQLVEYTLIDDKEQMKIFHDAAYAEMERLASEGIYPEGFDKASYDDMKRWEKTVRPDMLFCGAPHLLIPHAPLGKGEPRQDVLIAGTYFELLCASRGLGSVMLTFPLGVLNLMPEIKAMLKIPENHYIGMLIGFGYPQIKYRCGSMRIIEKNRIHRLKFDK